MNNSNFHFVNTQETLGKQDYNISENHSEDVLNLDPMKYDLDTSEQKKEGSSSDISKPKYYRLDRVVFAEPLEESKSTEDSGIQGVGEIIIVDNVFVKKTPGKKNKKYFIDVKDDCMECPLTNCSQTFATKALLKAHVRKVHCATTQYMCEQCGAGFTARYLLKRHSVIHSGGKKQCTVCGKWLSQRTSISVHMKTHGATKRHECAACGKRFMRRATLVRHQKFVHRSGDLRDKIDLARNLEPPRVAR